MGGLGRIFFFFFLADFCRCLNGFEQFWLVLGQFSLLWIGFGWFIEWASALVPPTLFLGASSVAERNLDCGSPVVGLEDRRRVTVVGLVFGGLGGGSKSMQARFWRCYPSVSEPYKKLCGWKAKEA